MSWDSCIVLWLGVTDWRACRLFNWSIHMEFISWISDENCDGVGDDYLHRGSFAWLPTDQINDSLNINYQIHGSNNLEKVLNFTNHLEKSLNSVKVLQKSIHQFYCLTAIGPTEWQINYSSIKWSIGWLINWLIGWLIDWLIYWLIDWLID